MNKKIHHIIGLLAIIIMVLLTGSALVQNANANSFSDFFKNIWGGHNVTPVPASPASAPYAPTVDYEAAVVNAVDQGLKSVVSIAISKDVPVLEQCPYNPFGDLGPDFNNFFGDNSGMGQFYTQCPTGKNQKQDIGGGSGFIVSADGLILTNKHVVADTKADYTVVLGDGSKYPAKVLARDPNQDIALIKIDKTGLTAAKLGDSNSIKLGQTAIAIGNALAQFSNTVSVGVVSGLSRSITASGAGTGGSEDLANLIQTDAAINPGNSGGPLLNLKGEVIGINVAVAQGAQNIGFTIPINTAKRDIDSVVKSGVIKTAYIGVRYTMITADMAKTQKLSSDYGALIRGSADGPAVMANSPADKAGLKAEDIILEVNGVKLDNATHTLASELQNYNVGDTVNLKVKRGSDVLTIQVTLGERPAA